MEAFPQSPHNFNGGGSVRSGSNPHLHHESSSHSPKATTSPRHHSASTFSPPRPSHSSSMVGQVSSNVAASSPSSSPLLTEKLCFVYVTTNGRIFAVPGVDEDFLRRDDGVEWMTTTTTAMTTSSESSSSERYTLKSTSLNEALEKSVEGKMILRSLAELGFGNEEGAQSKRTDFVRCLLYS